PLNTERRFIPMRLDKSPIINSLAQFVALNWLSEDREQEYAILLEACRPPAKPRSVRKKTAREQVAEKAIQLDYKGAAINAYAFSPDGKLALSASDDNSVRLWNVETGHSLRVFDGHAGEVWSLAWSADQRRALSGADDNTVRLWDVET